jgi:hypothetical protein
VRDWADAVTNWGCAGMVVGVVASLLGQPWGLVLWFASAILMIAGLYFYWRDQP